MFLDVKKYSGVYAKACALRSKLFDYDDYLKLLSCENLKQCSELLGQYEDYREAAEAALEYGASRLVIERSLLKALYSDYASMYSFMTEEGDRKYLDSIFLKYGIDIIKRLIRRIYDKRDIQKSISSHSNYMSVHLNIDVEKLSSSQNMDDFLENLKGTEFYDVLSKINRETATLFDYETQLDFYGYLKRIRCQERFLQLPDKLSQRHLNGCIADLHNIMWIFRAKTFYEISNDMLYTYLMPYHYRFKKENIKSLVECADESAFESIISFTKYKDVFKNFTVGQMENDFRSYMNLQYTKETRKNPFSLTTVITHIYFKGEEIKNLITVIECIRYKLQIEDSIKKLNIREKVGDNLD